MTELFGGNYFSTAWPHPSTETVFGGAQSLLGHRQSPIRSVIKVNWSLDFLKVPSLLISGSGSLAQLSYSLLLQKTYKFIRIKFPTVPPV